MIQTNVQEPIDDMGACQSTPVSTRDLFLQAEIVIVKTDISEKQTTYELIYNGHPFQYVERVNGSSFLRNIRNNERCVMENVKQYITTILYVAEHNDYPVVNIQVWHAEGREVRFHFNSDNYGYLKLLQILKQHHITHSDMTRKRFISARMTVEDVAKLKTILKEPTYQWIDFTQSVVA